jgi:hypothetical protein
MKTLKYVIWGCTSILLRDLGGGKANIDGKLLGRVAGVFNALRSKGIESVILSNRTWTVGQEKTPLKEAAKKLLGDVRWFSTNELNLPAKQTGEAFTYVLGQLGIEPNEALFVGNTKEDMQGAKNSHMLFINGLWYDDSTDYGWRVKEPEDVAALVELYFIRKHGWGFEIEDGSLRYYALAPFGTYGNQQSVNYSNSALGAAKHGSADAGFWGKYLCATLFLSGLYREIFFVCPFPSHEAGVYKDSLRKELAAFSRCFGTKYLTDLIVRHTTARESKLQSNSMTHADHLTTLHLNPKPTWEVLKQPRPYGSLKKNKGKTVLVLDDFCTGGKSLEAARVLLEAAGFQAITMSWLKTKSRDFVAIAGDISGLTPFAPATTAPPYKTRVYRYSDAYSDPAAATELDAKLEQYRKHKV